MSKHRTRRARNNPLPPSNQLISDHVRPDTMQAQELLRRADEIGLPPQRLVWGVASILEYEVGQARERRETVDPAVEQALAIVQRWCLGDELDQEYAEETDKQLQVLLSQAWPDKDFGNALVPVAKGLLRAARSFARRQGGASTTLAIALGEAVAALIRLIGGPPTLTAGTTTRESFQRRRRAQAEGYTLASRILYEALDAR